MARYEKTFLTKILPRTHAIAESAANHEFVVMLNPKYRGANFKWENFPRFVERTAEVMCWRPFTDSEWRRWEKEIKEEVRESAKRAAERILKESGVLEWWPDPTRIPSPPVEGEPAP
jgi:hypothetical protein